MRQFVLLAHEADAGAVVVFLLLLWSMDTIADLLSVVSRDYTVTMTYITHLFNTVSSISMSCDSCQKISYFFRYIAVWFDMSSGVNKIL